MSIELIVSIKKNTCIKKQETGTNSLKIFEIKNNKPMETFLSYAPLKLEDSE